MDDRDFFETIQKPTDERQEWLDAAEAHTRLMERSVRAEPIEPIEKTAAKTGFDEFIDWIDEDNARKRGVSVEEIRRQETEKKAALTDHLPRELTNPLGIAAMIAGAGLGAGYLYHGSKPQESLGGKSKAEHAGEQIVAAQNARGEEGQGFSHKLVNRLNETAAAHAKTFREHPVKAALTVGAPMGASTGLLVARMLGAASHGIKKG